MMAIDDTLAHAVVKSGSFHTFIHSLYRYSVWHSFAIPGCRATIMTSSSVGIHIVEMSAMPLTNTVNVVPLLYSIMSFSLFNTVSLSFPGYGPTITTDSFTCCWNSYAVENSSATYETPANSPTTRLSFSARKSCVHWNTCIRETLYIETSSQRTYYWIGRGI